MIGLTTGDFAGLATSAGGVAGGGPAVVCGREGGLSFVFGVRSFEFPSFSSFSFGLLDLEEPKNFSIQKEA